MLKYETLDIPVKNCRKLKYFQSLGYDTSGDIIKVKISDLNIGSKILVSVICDYCDNENEIFYKEYRRNISFGGKYACCKSCGALKTEETNLQKYGAINSMCLLETQERVKKTNLQKYGVEYLQQSNDIKERTKKTSLEKWGVDHISKTNEMKLRSSEWMSSGEFKAKAKATLFKNYNVTNPSKSDIIKEKRKNTISNFSKEDWDKIGIKIRATKLERWGDKNYNNIERVKEFFLNLTDEEKNKILNKSKATKLERWGDENYNNPQKIKESLSMISSEDWVTINNKRTKKLLENWGVKRISHSEDFRVSNFEIAKNKNYIKYINSSTSLFSCDAGHEFEIKTDNFYHRNKANLSLCTVCNPIGDLKSIKERELFNFIKSIYFGEIIQSYRDGLEIDIYLPKLHLGFEFNGLYWHSESKKDKWYHFNKTKWFGERGIRIIHIWEDDWVYKRDILESQIRNWLGISENRIFARNCTIIEIDNSKISNKFLEENHIQGSVSSQLKLGLLYRDELVSVMTFDHLEGRKKMDISEWNINRFCNKINHNVIGAASKLFKYFLKKYNACRVISYADRDWSNGDLYFELGFEKINESKPDYKYILNGIRVHKSRFKKSIIGYESTESQYTKGIGIERIWDCGKIKFEFFQRN